MPSRSAANSCGEARVARLVHFLSRPVVAMRVVVAVARSRISLLIAMLVNMISVMVSIAAVAPRDSCDCHHH